MAKKDDIFLALPKGRILQEIRPLFDHIDIRPEKNFYDESSRQLAFSTNIPNLKIIRIRSFDVATFVAFGAAQIGVAGNDVLMEFDYPDIYAPIDLKLGICRMSLAAAKKYADKSDFKRQSHIRVATKYPNTTKKYFAEKGVQAECVKLSGAIELAPVLGLSNYIVDLVSTGKTLKENGMAEVEKIADVSSRLIVNRTAFKTRGKEIGGLIDSFEKALSALKKVRKNA